ncbi:HU family DNA-binding protein [Candidatus Sumerlaeota bacterium]|nr:HU family DNA-binding protein [Candidatus Sumerlaeota bacterium]
MTKAEWVEAVAKAADLSKAKAQEVIDVTFDEVSKAIKKDKKFLVPGFGSFVVTKRKARKGRNPKTGEEIKIKASKSVRFKPAKSLKDAV